MLIHPNIQIRDLGLYLIKEKILVIGDLHIGYEEELNKKGVMVPRFGFEDLMKRVKNMLKDVETVVINGDLKHEFGTISKTEWNQTKKFLNILKGKRIVLIKGNHDTILKPIVKDIELLDAFQVGDVLICHGDEIVNQDCKVIVIGHEHVAVGLKEGIRVERYKCFLKGKYKRKILIAMPSCNLVTTGTDILKESRLSPYLQQKLDTFEVFIVSDKVYDFGRVKDLHS
jgi:uncharacterized protein